VPIRPNNLFLWFDRHHEMTCWKGWRHSKLPQSVPRGAY
jgi:hypothetical protein